MSLIRTEYDDLGELLAPFLHVVCLSVPLDRSRVSVEAVVRVAEPVADDVAARAAAMAQFEAAMVALKASEWRHDEYPETTISGGVIVTPACYTLAGGEPVIPEKRELGYVKMTVRLQLIPPGVRA